MVGVFPISQKTEQSAAVKKKNIYIFALFCGIKSDFNQTLNPDWTKKSFRKQIGVKLDNLVNVSQSDCDSHLSHLSHW